MSEQPPNAEPNPTTPKGLRDRTLRFWREWIKPLLVVVIVLGSFRSSVADWNDVPTGSMRPTIIEGDRIVVNKLAYDVRVPLIGWRLVHRGDPQRGDVVICYSPADGTRLVKRVIAGPGDRIELRRNRLIVNGQPAQYVTADADVIDQLEADERRHYDVKGERIAERTYPVMRRLGWAWRRSYGPVTIPAGQYFMMGDNRDNSLDSRTFGFIARDQIVGRAFGVAISLDREHYYQPRWDRFFRGMP